MNNLLKFAQHAVALIIGRNSPRSPASFEKRRLMDFITAEQMAGHTGEVSAMRAAARLYQTKRNEQRGKFFVKPDQNNRLLELLSLPKSIGAELPKQDIRGLILKSSLAGLLKQASGFSPDILKSVLGEEWLKHVKPIGFTDDTQKTILFAVKSPSVAHELSFRKHEILSRLRKIREFKEVTDIRFKAV